MKRLAVLLITLLLAGCASLAPPAPPPLFEDHLFGKADPDIGAARIFAIDDDMKRYVDALRRSGDKREIQRTLFEALYRKDQLRLEYDSAATRTAAETFAARRGNCLSLVIMTAALAREMGMRVHYQTVTVEDTWSRTGSLYFASGHVNLVLGKPINPDAHAYDNNQFMVIDFQPPEDAKYLSAQEISESRVVSMFMNNRAAEALSHGQLDRAYWWARKAIEADPSFLSPYNTLAIVYQQHGNLKQAEAALRYAELVQPDNKVALHNLVQVLSSQGRTAEADALRDRLARLDPNPPFHYFQLGQKAMQEGNYRKARTMFAREVDRAPYYHEFHFWLAVASFKLDDIQTADKHMKLAMENSTTRGDHALYAGKLDRLKSLERKRESYSN